MDPNAWVAMRYRLYLRAIKTLLEGVELHDKEITEEEEEQP